MRSSSFTVCLVALAIVWVSIASPMQATVLAVRHGSNRAQRKMDGHATAKATDECRCVKSLSKRGKGKSMGKFKSDFAALPGAGRAGKPARRAAGRGGSKAWPRLAGKVAGMGDAISASGKFQSVHLAMPPPLKGSHESLVHQNAMAEADGLERIVDDADLEDRIAHGSLVPVPVSTKLGINGDLPENRRYCRPWTAQFLTSLVRAFAQRFPSAALQVTSAVRTVAYQRQLRLVNGNAAAADGDIASPHLTGGTIDLAKKGLTARQIGWLRAWLLPLQRQGKIDVEEEFRQACFHISVYKSYTDASARATMPESSHTAIPRGR